MDFWMSMCIKVTTKYYFKMYSATRKLIWSNGTDYCSEGLGENIVTSSHLLFQRAGAITSPFILNLYQSHYHYCQLLPKSLLWVIWNSIRGTVTLSSIETHTCTYWVHKSHTPPPTHSLSSKQKNCSELIKEQADHLFSEREWRSSSSTLSSLTLHLSSLLRRLMATH